MNDARSEPPSVIAPHLQKNDSIESLRGVAALMVLLYHLAELMKVPVPGSLGFVSSHFGLGVPLFYTLSGFVLAYGYADKLDGVLAVRRFYIRRLFRIAPLFFVMLALWLLANWVVWNKTFPLQTLFLNVSFLFGLVPGQHESIVWAGWSIGIEMLFYLMFPVISVLLPSLTTSLVAFAASCVLSNAVFHAFTAAGLGSYAYMNLGNHLPFFMAGLVSFRIWQATKFQRLPACGWALFVTAGVTAVMIGSSDRLYGLLSRAGMDRSVWAIVFAMLLLSACYARNPVLERGPLKNLGKLSFSLYLLHPMIMVVLIKLELPARVAGLTESTLAGFLIATAITLGIVWLVSMLSFRFVEQPGIAFGRRASKRL